MAEAAEKRGYTLGNLARHPLTGGVLNVIGVTAGIFGAIVANDVRNYIASFWTDHSPEYDSKAVAYFGGASLTLVVLFAFRQWAVDRQRRRDHVAMQRIAERIQSTLRTHPPAKFMQELGIALEKSFVIARSASTDEQRQTAIRLILHHVAELAQTFEGSTSIKAGANLMIFLRREEPVSALWPQWYATIKFFDGDPAGLDGMLVLSPRLTAAPDGSGGSDPALREDSRITPLALPVPSDPGGSSSKRRDPGGPSSARLWNVLPGAPMAFVRKDFEWFSPVSELHSWCSNNCDLREQVKRQLREYFDGKSFESFMSVPVFSSTAAFKPAEQRQVCGVLNIHWEGGSRLTIVEAANNFQRAIYPFCVLLSELLKTAPTPTPTTPPPSS